MKIKFQQADFIAFVLLFTAFLALMFCSAKPKAEELQPPGCDVLPEPENVDLVFTSAPLMTEPFLEWEDQTNSQMATDVGLIWKGIAEWDLNARINGENVSIYNCTTSPENCAAHEGRVSPDGEKVAFTLMEATSLAVHNSKGGELFSDTKKSRVMIWEVKTGKLYEAPNQPPHPAKNRSPAWQTNEDLVFLSDCGVLKNNSCTPFYLLKDAFSQHRGVHKDGSKRWSGEPYGVSPYYLGMKKLQLWKTKIKGEYTPVNWTPHENIVLRPEVMKLPQHEGRVAFSHWQSQEEKAFYSGDPSNFPRTALNLFWLSSVDSNGMDQATFLGGHKHWPIHKKSFLPPDTIGGQNDDFLYALRTLSETDEPFVFETTTYYRKNHNSLGFILKFFILDWRVEGFLFAKNVESSNRDYMRKGSGKFTPKMYATHPYGTGQDTTGGTMYKSTGERYGKSGFPARLPDGRKMVTWAEGFCYQGTYPEAIKESVWYKKGKPGNHKYLCDSGIYEVLVDVVTDPFDETQLKPLLETRTHREYDAQYLGATQMPNNKFVEPIDSNCEIRIVDSKAAGIYTAEPWKFSEDYKRFALQGAVAKPEDENYYYNNVKYIAVYGLEPHLTTYPSKEFGNSINYHGYKNKYLMGIASVDTNEDNSLKIGIPCNVAYQTSAMDADFKIIAHDSSQRSNRIGEKTACIGCHKDHDNESYIASGRRTPTERFAETDAYKKPAIILNSQWSISYSSGGENSPERILERNCGSCHEGFKNDDGLARSRIAADWEQMDWLDDFPRKVMREGFPEPKKYFMTRPYFSFLTHRFCNDSLLCWYAFDKRLDGRKNSDYPNDIDYNENHPVQDLSYTEKRIIVEWANQGYQL